MATEPQLGVMLLYPTGLGWRGDSRSEAGRHLPISWGRRLQLVGEDWQQHDPSVKAWMWQGSVGSWEGRLQCLWSVPVAEHGLELGH